MKHKSNALSPERLNQNQISNEMQSDQSHASASFSDFLEAKLHA